MQAEGKGGLSAGNSRSTEKRLEKNMKKTEFKVHTIYSKEDILQMQKTAGGKFRKGSFAVTGAIFILYVAVVLWERSRGEGYASLFSFIPGAVLDAVLIGILALTMILIYCIPYLQRRKILKSVPGGVLKANFYFYEKTFQYGWGDAFTTVAYVEIEEFKELPESFYMKAKGVAYWVKKDDFESGTPEAFRTFMQGKVQGKGK